MSEHSWCQNIPRDEAVRAAEDNRPGPLPTLEEAIAAVKERRPPEPEGGGNVTLRTERVTLEVTHSVPVAKWDWTNILETFRPGDSVRVVEEPESSDRRHRWDRDGERCLKCNDKDWMGGPCNTTNEEYIEKLKDERDAAIRERDQLRVKRDELQTGCIRLNAQLKQKNAPHKTALEAAIKGMERMQAERDAFKDLLAAAEYEPVANPFPTVGRMIEETCKQLALAMRVADIEKRRGDKCFAELKAAICERDELKARVAELESSAPAASGAAGKSWLTAEERKAIMYLIANRSQFAPQTPHEERRNAASRVCHDLLARSTPPEVVMPSVYQRSSLGDSLVALEQVKAALAAAGVPWKEVGRE